jgi:hypothetical protein
LAPVIKHQIMTGVPRPRIPYFNPHVGMLNKSRIELHVGEVPTLVKPLVVGISWIVERWTVNLVTVSCQRVLARRIYGLLALFLFGNKSYIMC